MRVLGPIVIAPQHLGSGSHHNVFSQGGMALAVVFARSPQGDALIQQAAVPDFGGFPDHHTHAVVDKHAVADAGAGMNFDASERTPHLAHTACDELERQAAAP